ncbi:MAG TPA: IS110 family transposase [Rhodocyclaceae bacterium]|nr:IS110 family transposase [Rhodocyclaceae bacterium]
MAIPLAPFLVGVDVSKATLSLCTGPDASLQELPNQPRAIARWLKTLPGSPVCIAVEATNTFHVELVTQAHRQGHTVYLIDGYRLSRYRDSIGGRAKTDASDARLLHRYLAHEHQDLRPWSPPPEGYLSLQRLLRRRAAVVKSRVALRQSLAGLPEFKTAAEALFRQIARLEDRLQERILLTLDQLQWGRDRRRCQAIEGVGPLTSAALATSFRRAPFANSDAFIAFIGFDVRARDSGQWHGRRKLSKRGDPEVRRLLYLAAMRACRTAAWQPFYQRCLGRGLAKIQALVILARKLARVAFALLKTQTDYHPRLQNEACATT